MFSTMKHIMEWAGAYRKRLYIGFVCSFLAAWCTAGPIMTAAWALNKLIVDSQGGEKVESSLVWITIAAIAGLILLRFFFTYWKNRLQESIGCEQVAKQRLKLGDILKRVSLGYFADNDIGEILAALTTELSVLELQAMKMVDRVINGYIQAAAVIFFILFVSPPAGLTALAGVLLSALALRRIGRESAVTAPITHTAQEQLAGAALEYIRGLQVVKSFGQEGISISRFRDASQANCKIRIKNEFGFVPWNCLHLFFIKSASVALVLITAVQTNQGTVTMQILLMIAMFSFTIFGSVEMINDAAHLLSVIDTVFEKVGAMEQAEYIDQEGKEITPEHFDISFRDVSFAYKNREVLKDVSFYIPEHSTTAIIGPSGCGKSTICRLIARFYDVKQGGIEVGGHDVREMTCSSLMKNISMVFQNVYLFHDTIYNNIKFGKPDATRKEIISAAKAARCHDFIMALPNGYDTIIGEGGSTLSGGEKQRVSIARAMLKNAPIIILDEATASIDPENEHEIQQAISLLVTDKTLITIAHRMATVESADQILVMDDGRIVQRGTHQDLIDQEGIYKEFIRIRKFTEEFSM